MSVNLDLKNFHKVETSDSHTKLEHASGHQLVIAHKGLSQEMRKQLEELPASLAKGGYAKFAQANDPNMKAAKAAKASKSTNTMPGSPTDVKKAYTEPNAMGTSIPKEQLEDEMTNGQQPDVVLSALNRKAPPFGPLSSEPKQHYPPCINPSCKSYGKSHPNCLCYGGGSEHSGVGTAGYFADGGEVSDEYFCDNDRPHFKKCEYYAIGGRVVKGVHKSSMDVERPQNRSEKRWAGESDAGDLVRNSDIQAVSKTSAKDEHHKVLGEMKAMPKPKLQGLADGGEAGDDDTSNLPQLQQPQMLQDQPADDPSTQQPDSQEVPEQSQQVQDPQMSPNQNAAGIDPYQQYQQTALNTNKLLNDEHNKFIQEVDSGQVKPKTMQDLFHDKSTIGKIGTLFGMIVAGGGAGLTHTDNAVIGTMQKEINNDLLAQEQNQANRRNIMSINGQNLTALANAGKIGTDIRQAQIAMSKAQANYYLYNQLAQQANNISDPKQAQKAGQVLALMRDSMQKDNASAFAQASGANALGQMMRGGNTTALKTGLFGPEMQEYGNDVEAKQVPGVGMASRPAPEGMRQTLTSQQNLDMKLKDLQDYVKKNVGTADWQKYPIAKQKAMEAIRMYSTSLGGPNGQGKLDDLEKQIAGGKNPLNPIKYLLGQPGRIQEIRDANNMQYQNNMQSLGIRGKPLSTGSSSPQQNQTIERLDPASGKTVIYDAKTKKPLRWK